jgi:hypothetical protein
MWLYPVPIGTWPGWGGGVCNRELRRIPIPRTPVNKGTRKQHSPLGLYPSYTLYLCGLLFSYSDFEPRMQFVKEVLRYGLNPCIK